VPGSSRIQTRQNRFQLVPSIGIRELTSSAADSPSPIQNKPSDIDRRPVYPRFAKIILERRVRLKKWTSSLCWCHFQRVACGRRRLQLDPFDLARVARTRARKETGATATATARRNLRLETVDETKSAIPESARSPVDLQTVRKGKATGEPVID
jgi:hypothetical protein